jgi:hypothetical protein
MGEKVSILKSGRDIHMGQFRRILTPGMDSPLTGTQGWRQFMGARKKMLGAYLTAKEEATGHEVQVWHGKVGEGWVRQWLHGFLPRKYGVTSGYIVSQGQTEETKLPHFDVIIYDRLEAPVLWIENTPDATEIGTSRAIPAEFVRGVLEVKAAFNTKSVADAIEHLSDLDSLLQDVDAPNQQFKKFLPQRFFTAVVFFELRNEDRNAWSALSKFIPDRNRVWPGGLILSGEGLRPEMSATIGVTHNTNSPPQPIEQSGKDLLNFAISDSVPFCGAYRSAIMQWTPNEFSKFSFDLLAMLNGTYQPGRSSSNHAMSWVDVPKKEEK